MNYCVYCKTVRPSEHLINTGFILFLLQNIPQKKSNFGTYLQHLYHHLCNLALFYNEFNGLHCKIPIICIIICSSKKALIQRAKLLVFCFKIYSSVKYQIIWCKAQTITVLNCKLEQSLWIIMQYWSAAISGYVIINLSEGSLMCIDVY